VPDLDFIRGLLLLAPLRITRRRDLPLRQIGSLSGVFWLGIIVRELGFCQSNVLSLTGSYGKGDNTRVRHGGGLAPLEDTCIVWPIPPQLRLIDL
jgi:hypothetical protein